jgi:hypothetical protein
MNPIAEDNSSAEREPRLRAVAVDEFINRVPVPSLCSRSQAVQKRRILLVQSGNRRTVLGLGRVRFEESSFAVLLNRATMLCLPGVAVKPRP